MDDIEKVLKYLSVQPFWEAQKLNQALIFLEQTGEPVAFAYEMAVSTGAQGLQSVPGAGLICLSFSLDPEYQFGQCYGPLNKSKLIPVINGGARTFNCHFFLVVLPELLVFPVIYLRIKKYQLRMC